MGWERELAEQPPPLSSGDLRDLLTTHHSKTGIMQNRVCVSLTKWTFETRWSGSPDLLLYSISLLLSAGQKYSFHLRLAEM